MLILEQISDRYYTLLLAKLVGRNGKVYAFEPDPTNFNVLRKNVELNGYKNVILEQKAVSNKSGSTRLFLKKNSAGEHAIYDLHDGREFVLVETVTLDEYFKYYNGNVNLIKMDVEGAEGGIFQGMQELLKRSPNLMIFTEFYPVRLKEFGIGAKEYLDMICQSGFKIYQINERKKRLEQVELNTLLRRYTVKNMRFTNLICMPVYSDVLQINYKGIVRK